MCALEGLKLLLQVLCFNVLSVEWVVMISDHVFQVPDLLLEVMEVMQDVHLGGMHVS